MVINKIMKNLQDILKANGFTKTYVRTFKVKHNSSLPVYMQLIEVILEDIKIGKLEAGDILPSLHLYSTTLCIAKGTVEKAYRKLKTMGYVSSWPGKGYFVLDTKLEIVN